jgi:hypothetical protein
VRPIAKPTVRETAITSLSLIPAWPNSFYDATSIHGGEREHVIVSAWPNALPFGDEWNKIRADFHPARAQLSTIPTVYHRHSTAYGESAMKNCAACFLHMLQCPRCGRRLCKHRDLSGGAIMPRLVLRHTRMHLTGGDEIISEIALDGCKLPFHARCVNLLPAGSAVVSRCGVCVLVQPEPAPSVQKRNALRSNLCMTSCDLTHRCALNTGHAVLQFRPGASSKLI